MVETFKLYCFTKWLRISNLHLQFIVWHLYLNSHNKWNVGDVWKFLKVGTWILLFVLTQDGDYNKPIPTQYNGDLNHPVSCEQGDFISNNDVLCEKCSRNQLLKTKQLAAFVPLNEVLSYWIDIFSYIVFILISLPYIRELVIFLVKHMKNLCFEKWFSCLK